MPKNIRWGLAIPIFFGVTLRLIQYFAAASLRLDEAMLALNIVSASVPRLVSAPLEYGQVAPPVFLILAKISALTFGDHELALRLPALISSIATLFIFAVFANRYAPPRTAIIATTILAVAPALIRFSAETKQYSGDVLAAVALIYTGMRICEHQYKGKWIKVAVILGPVVALFSQTSVIVMTGVGAVLAFVAIVRESRTAISRCIPIGLSWGASCFAAIILGFHSMTSPMRMAMRDYWSFAFLPWTGTLLTKGTWTWRTFSDLYSQGLGFWRVGDFCIAIAALGCVALWRSGQKILVGVVTAPVIVGVAVAATHQYPLWGRLALYILPTLALTFAAGVTALGTALSNRIRMSAVLVPTILLIPPFYVIGRYHPPWYDEEIKPVLAHVSAKRSKGDEVYVFYGAVPAMRFYQKRFGFNRTQWVEGTGHRDDPSLYRKELARFRGHDRVWVLFAHDVIAGERDAILKYLDTIGSELVDFRFPSNNEVRPDAIVYLFDLTEPPLSVRVPK